LENTVRLIGLTPIQVKIGLIPTDFFGLISIKEICNLKYKILPTNLIAMVAMELVLLSRNKFKLKELKRLSKANKVVMGAMDPVHHWKKTRN
jgi:hypothetical protein